MAKSWLDTAKLREEARAVGIDEDWLTVVCDRLDNGASLGCEGAARLPTRGRNSDSAIEEGEKLADTLQTWVKQGIVAGPFREEELPWSDFTTSPLMVRRKPDNSMRVILDMSSPHLGEEQLRNPHVPRSVNAGIDGTLFPTKMTSILKVLEAIHYVGCECEACKIDWANAYKHQAIRLEDLKLQVIMFGGRFFVETQATFGCSSSPGIFDSLSYLILEIAIRNSQMDRMAIEKQLDDVIAFGGVGTGACERFYNEYRRVCTAVGVQLAPEDDPEKAFNKATEGVILGVFFDLKNWTWRLPEDRMSRLVHQLEEIIKCPAVTNGFAMMVTGRLTHYRHLVTGGTWERGFLLKLPNTKISKEEWRTVTEEMKVQARWWQSRLLAAREFERIPDMRKFETFDRIVLSTDAAGGNGKKGRGMGGVLAVKGERIRWFAMTWPDLIKHNKRNNLGITFGQKLSMLEGLAVLAGLVGDPVAVQDRAVIAFCDNAGFVWGWTKHCSKDLFVYTVAKAVHDVARGLGVNLVVRKVSRCSDGWSRAADALSKSDFQRAFVEMEDRERKSMRIPRALLKWAKDPRPTSSLGSRILEELTSEIPGIRVRDYMVRV